MKVLKARCEVKCNNRQLQLRLQTFRFVTRQKKKKTVQKLSFSLAPDWFISDQSRYSLDGKDNACGDGLPMFTRESCNFVIDIIL